MLAANHPRAAAQIGGNARLTAGEADYVAWSARLAFPRLRTAKS